MKFLTLNSGGSRIFPRRGRQLPGLGAPTYDFPKNCKKLKEFGPPGVGGGAPATA